MDNCNIELIRGHMDTIILRTLEKNDKYGLEILNEIRELSEDLYSLKQPTLYSSLKRLENKGYIKSYPGVESKGANRTYYSLTEEGRNFLISDQKEWEFSRTIIDKLLSDKVFDKSNDRPFDPSEFRPSTKRERKEKVIIKYVEVERPQSNSTFSQNDNYSSEKSTSNVDNNEILSQNESSTFDNREDYYDNSIEHIQNNDNSSNSIQYIESDIENVENDYNDNDNISAINYYANSASLPNNEIENNFSNEMQKSNDLYRPYSTNVTESQINSFNSEYYSKSQDEVLESSRAFDMTNENTKVQEQKANENKLEKEYTYDYSRENLNYNNKPKAIADDLDIDNDADYISAFNNMFDVSSHNQNHSYNQNNYSIDNTPKTNNINVNNEKYYNDITMNELKNMLSAKNIKLKPHYKNNTFDFYNNKYYYINKVLRDWSIITYLLFATFLLVSYFTCKKFGVSLNITLIFLFSALLLPIGCTINWTTSPKRRKRTTFSFVNTMLTICVVMLAIGVIIILTGFFFVQINLSNPNEYIKALILPCVSLIIMPISALVYGILYNKKSYRVG